MDTNFIFAKKNERTKKTFIHFFFSVFCITTATIIIIFFLFVSNQVCCKDKQKMNENSMNNFYFGICVCCVCVNIGRIYLMHFFCLFTMKDRVSTFFSNFWIDPKTTEYSSSSSSGQMCVMQMMMLLLLFSCCCSEWNNNNNKRK